MEGLERIEREMEQVTVHVEVEVNPTENEANVKAAVLTFLATSNLHVNLQANKTS